MHPSIQAFIQHLTSRATGVAAHHAGLRGRPDAVRGARVGWAWGRTCRPGGGRRPRLRRIPRGSAGGGMRRRPSRGGWPACGRSTASSGVRGWWPPTRRRPPQPEATAAAAQPLRVEDVIPLLDAIPTAEPPGVRDRAMFETLYGGGLRVGELVGLDLADLDPEQGLVRVRGKGRRERLCPLGPMALRPGSAAGSPLRQPKRPGEARSS